VRLEILDKLKKKIPVTSSGIEPACNEYINANLRFMSQLRTDELCLSPVS
jgi:hypothetical protein